MGIKGSDFNNLIKEAKFMDSKSTDLKQEIRKGINITGFAVSGVSGDEVYFTANGLHRIQKHSRFVYNKKSKEVRANE